MGIIFGILAINSIATIDGMRRENERRRLQQYRMQQISEMTGSSYLHA